MSTQARIHPNETLTEDERTLIRAALLITDARESTLEAFTALARAGLHRQAELATTALDGLDDLLDELLPPEGRR